VFFTLIVVDAVEPRVVHGEIGVVAQTPQVFHAQRTASDLPSLGVINAGRMPRAAAVEQQMLVEQGHAE